MNWWVYILKCSDNPYYTGSTDDLDRRVAQHQAGEGGEYTSARLPIILVYAQEFHTHDEAFRWERQIKGWSRKKKEAVIQGKYDALPMLSKNYSGAEMRKQRH